MQIQLFLPLQLRVVWALNLFGHLDFGNSNLPFDLAQGGESFDFAQDRESIDVAQNREPVERPVERLAKPIGICDLLFEIS